MKMTITQSDFRNQFEYMNRAENFSYNGLAALYDYLEDINPDYDLDVIELCCTYTEFSDLDEYNKNYEPVESIDDIENCTTVIRLSGDAFIIENY